MASLAQINDTQVSIINFKSVPVITTAMLADFYGTDINNIQQNYTRNKGRFIEGKHFFKIVGQELKSFVTDLKSVANFSKVRSLILWTERGAARHAKMLDTDQAWEVFEQLEDCYFVRKEILAKTHKSERTALHEAHALLVTKTKHLNVSDAWKMIHQRFNVDDIKDIPYDVIPVAVEYVHHLIALYSNAEKLKQSPNFETHAYNAASHLLWVSAWWRCFGDSIRMLNPTMASRIHDHFADGAFSASLTLGSERSKELGKRIQQDYPYMLRQCDLIDFFRHS
ncbi:MULTISPECIES: ORF6N domain-containing protein [unclassified Acinetobacter]|uniref:ORF6N domain-containing protein n=1 Tax=unclassified Acinetobacter TaxID=196816 RepID=UPI00244B0196|nr:MULTISPECIES: ORF6N domain-containing protein [unclassified Acinetobacter]MDH0032008.1 ORF6N domain-containing protein [Acinetobacter sp. GD04021]MDH0887664.1 ORF6N domain-containing protein [Acinetobacter sp. GD03873]MDH1084012.1 ORF6N domain-containing protein [Acinetobacter sp. GD03983]MDH2191061.1 ORF6N domain-containing protein [Acinetobacter sp. GD03645]MDH2204524.1 ORF6N domain-containing protein [Acinetobacter sp. GD03647]